jgi:hypothetical protein
VGNDGGGAIAGLGMFFAGYWLGRHKKERFGRSIDMFWIAYSITFIIAGALAVFVKLLKLLFAFPRSQRAKAPRTSQRFSLRKEGGGAERGLRVLSHRARER